MDEMKPPNEAKLPVGRPVVNAAGARREAF
jgi:hypothetical protein